MRNSASITKPTMWCRGCWHVLDGLGEPRCPECGRPFDPANRRTYRTKPPRWWLASLQRRLRPLKWPAVVVGVLSAILLAIFIGWQYRCHAVEQRAIAKLMWVLGSYRTAPIWPMASLMHQRSTRPSRLPFLRTVVGVGFGRRVADADLKQLAAFTSLERLWLEESQVTDTGLAHLGRPSNLKELRLENTRVTDSGLVHLKRLTKLEILDLGETQVTDAGLVHLKTLTNLGQLFLNQTQTTREGIADLKRALPNIRVYGR